MEEPPTWAGKLQPPGVGIAHCCCHADLVDEPVTQKQPPDDDDENTISTDPSSSHKARRSLSDGCAYKVLSYSIRRPCMSITTSHLFTKADVDYLPTVIVTVLRQHRQYQSTIQPTAIYVHALL
jgi:hypothetical protein